MPSTCFKEKPWRDCHAGTSRLWIIETIVGSPISRGKQGRFQPLPLPALHAEQGFDQGSRGIDLDTPAFFSGLFRGNQAKLMQARAQAARGSRQLNHLMDAFAGQGLANRRQQRIDTGAVARRRPHAQRAIAIEMVANKDGKMIFQERALTARGDYEPGREADGRKKALEFLVNTIVDKAQSRW